MFAWYAQNMLVELVTILIINTVCGIFEVDVFVCVCM